MRCPECSQTFKILKSRLFDFTKDTLGCPHTGHWPKYTARVYVDNVQVLKCKCGISPRIPRLSGLQILLFGGTPGDNVAETSIKIDPLSGLIYVGTWDEDDGWILSQHQEH